MFSGRAGGSAFLLGATNDLPTRLSEALAEIRNVAVSCEFTIPDPRQQVLGTGARPTRVLICDSSCRAVKADPRARVDLRFGCKSLVVQ